MSPELEVFWPQDHRHYLCIDFPAVGPSAADLQIPVARAHQSSVQYHAEQWLRLHPQVWQTPRLLAAALGQAGERGTSRVSLALQRIYGTGRLDRQRAHVQGRTGVRPFEYRWHHGGKD